MKEIKSWHIGLFSILLLCFFLFLLINVHRNKINSLESMNKDYDLRLSSIEKQVPGIAKYMLLVKELSTAAGNKMTAYEATEVAKIIIVQCALNEDIGLTPSLIMGIMERESNFNPSAISYAKAYGLMQVIETTWAIHAADMAYGRFTEDIALDPIVNVQVGIKELVRLRKYWLENGVDSFLVTINSYFWGTTHTWELLTKKKRASLPSLEYGKGVLDLAKKWEEKGL